MDNKEALKYTADRGLEILLELEVTEANCRKERLNREYDFLTAARIALESRKPEKPLPDKRYYGNGQCPCCFAVFLDKSTNFCGNCGQALDWSV